MTPEEIAKFKEELANIIDFVDASIVWSPMYALLIIFLVNCWLLTYKKLRDARKQIRVLKLEKEMLFQEQAELKQVIHHLN